jgi:nitroreductase
MPERSETMTSSADNAATDGKISIDEVDIPVTDVSIYEALYRRRMSWRFQDEPIQREAVERMVEAAVWAPNHRLTEPWRFFILEKGSAAAEKVAGLAHDFALQRSGNEQRAAATRDSLLKTPVLIYAYSTPGRDEEGTKENYASVCCAAQNMALAGVAEGLAVTWETGGPTRHPDLAQTLGAEGDWTLATMLSVGYPAENPRSERTPVSNFVRWLD